VNACAPGVDVVGPIPNPTRSIAERQDDAPLMLNDTEMAETEEHLVKWSGTSFSAPVVVAALVRQSALEAGGDFPTKLAAAVQSLIDDPALLRLPMLGTVVNVA